MYTFEGLRKGPCIKRDVANEETRRRRKRQIAYNKENGITPKSITKSVSDFLPSELAAAFNDGRHSEGSGTPRKAKSIAKMSISELERAMWDAVDKLDFERAAVLRDAIAEKEEAEKGTR